MIADLLLIVFLQLRDHPGVHSIQAAAQLGIFEHHRLKRRIAGTLPDSKQGAVHPAGSIKPGSCGIGHRFVEIIVTVPFDQFTGNPCMGHDPIDDTLYRTGNHSSRIIDTISHGITAAHLDGDLVLFHQLHQLQAEWDHISINIRTGDILQMASGTYACFQTFLDHTQIVLHSLPAAHLHLIKDMVIRAAYQNPGLLHAHIPYQLKILLVGADPAGDLRELVTSLHTFLHSIPVFLAVKEEFALADLPVGSAQTVKIVIDRHDLFGTVRRP